MAIMKSNNVINGIEICVISNVGHLKRPGVAGDPLKLKKKTHVNERRRNVFY